MSIHFLEKSEIHNKNSIFCRFFRSFFRDIKSARVGKSYSPSDGQTNDKRDDSTSLYDVKGVNITYLRCKEN